MPDSMSGFAFTQYDVTVNIWVSIGAAVLSTFMCGAVLSLAYYVWTQPNTRPMIDRISFRLLLWSVAFEVVYDITYILTQLDSLFGLNDRLCSASLYFMIASMTTVNYLCTCIAVNLMLTITLGINPIKLKLEKWYVGTSVLIGVLVPIVPASLGHFRNDPTWSTCWVSGDSLAELTKRLILDLYLWQILSCTIATVAVLITLYTLYRQGRELSAALFAGNKMNQSIFGAQTPDLEAGQEKVEKRGKWSKLWRKGWKRAAKDSPLRSQLEDRFLIIAFQISLYPISLILINGFITIGELCVTQTGVTTRALYALYCIYYFLYGGRGIAFAALAFFIDPCFRRALGEAWRTRHTRTMYPSKQAIASTDSSDGEEVKQSFAEMLAAQTPSLPYDPNSADTVTFQTGSKFLSSESLDSDEDRLQIPTLDVKRSGSDASYDMPAALTKLAVETPARLGTFTTAPPLNQTKSFAGVPTGYLPREITDEMDVVSRPASPILTSPLFPKTHHPVAMTGLGVAVEDSPKSSLAPLSPDLPDPVEEERLRLRAEAEKKKVEEEREKQEMDEILHTFLSAKAML